MDARQVDDQLFALKQYLLNQETENKNQEAATEAKQKAVQEGTFIEDRANPVDANERIRFTDGSGLLLPSLPVHLKQKLEKIKSEGTAILATLAAIDAIEQNKPFDEKKWPRTSSAFFNLPGYIQTIAQYTQLPASVLEKMPRDYITRIDNLRPYFENFRNNEEPSMSIDAVLSVSNNEKRWNLMSLYALIKLNKITIKEALALTEPERREREAELKQLRKTATPTSP